MRQKRMQKQNKTISLDPLYQLFEQHLLTRSYDDAAGFTKQLASDYMAYVDSTLAHIPFHLRSQMIEDVEAEAHEMLVKKMYGCMNAGDYLRSGQVNHVTKNNDIIPCTFVTSTSNTPDNSGG